MNSIPPDDDSPGYSERAPEPETLLAHALALAALGFFVFPLRHDAKLPAHKGWQDEASRDRATLVRWFGSQSKHNIGTYAGRFGDGNEALIVVDLDTHDGKDGSASWGRLQEIYGDAPVTREHSTPSGGSHLFFRARRPVRQSTEWIAKALGTKKHGIDIRSKGGYVTTIGSAIGDGRYKVVTDAPIAEAPQWLIDQCGIVLPREPKTKAPSAEINVASATARATEWLTDYAELALEGAGGDATTFRVAARLKDFGVSEDAALDLMLERWNDRSSPPWLPNELAVKVRNAYEYGREPVGRAAPELEFSIIEAGAAGPRGLAADLAAVEQRRRDQEFWELPNEKSPAVIVPRPAARFELFDDVDPHLARPSLVKGLLDQGAASILYGKTNVGKTFVALDLGFHVGTGRPWFGRPVQQGAVVYVAGEGGGGVRKRIAALRLHYGMVGQHVPLALVPCALDLSGRGADQKMLLEIVRDVEERTGQCVRLIVLDTLARMLGGADENAQADAGAFVRNVDGIRAATGAHVLTVHHSGKDESKGARGSSRITADPDTVLEVRDGTVFVEKQRDLEADTPIAFELVTVPVGLDADGQQVASCVVVPRHGSAAADFGPAVLKRDGHAAKVRDLIANLTLGADNQGRPRTVGRDEVCEEFLAAKFRKPHQRHTGQEAFRRAWNLLLKARWLIEEGDRVRLVQPPPE